jgi:undecaprenyl diphosphate synthase
MDGNGRWARERGLPRIMGHRQGAQSVRAVTKACARKGVRQLTLYAFSTENWKRPASEVSFLMRLLKRFLVQEREEILENNIRFTTIGHEEDLPEPVQAELRETKRLSRDNTGMVLCLALSYGARREIADAARKLALDVKAGKRTAKSITEEVFAEYLDTAGMPDPDLVIRTAGELRLSNFLLWQASYAEIYVTEVRWPDFREAELDKALAAYARRQRRFGAVEPRTL